MAGGAPCAPRRSGITEIRPKNRGQVCKRVHHLPDPLSNCILRKIRQAVGAAHAVGKVAVLR